MKKEWKKEIARDCIALGSIPFYFIVIIRAIVGEYMPFVYQLLLALAVLFGLGYLVKGDVYVARVFIIWVFTSLFYKHNLYTVFAFLLWVLVIVSSRYLKTKKNVIIKGVVLGMVSSLVAYYLIGLVGASFI